MSGDGFKLQSDGGRQKGAFLDGKLNGWGEKVI